MSPFPGSTPYKARLVVLLDHFAITDDPRAVRRVAHPLAEVLLLVVCATLAGCDDYDHIAVQGEVHLDVLRRHLPNDHGTPGGRWLTILMNRINPALLSAAGHPRGADRALHPVLGAGVHPSRRSPCRRAAFWD